MYENSIPRQHGLAQTKPFALNYPPQQQQLRAEQISKMLLCTRLCAEMERSAGRCVEDATAIAKAWAREEFGEGSKSEIEVRAVKHSIDAFSGKVRVEVLYVAMPGTIMLVFRSVEGETLLLLDPEPPLLALGAPGMPPAWVRQTFWSKYSHLERSLMLRLASVAKRWADPHEPLNVIATGFRTGGALATLCAFCLAARWSTSQQVARVNCVSFSSPKVGDVNFAEQFDVLVSESVRVYTPQDVTPLLPPSARLCHVQSGLCVAECEEDKKVCAQNVRKQVSLLQMAQLLASDQAFQSASKYMNRVEKCLYESQAVKSLQLNSKADEAAAPLA